MGIVCSATSQIVCPLLSSLCSKQLLVLQVKIETDGGGEKKEEEVSKCPAEEQHLPTSSLPLHLLLCLHLHLHPGLPFAHVANPSHLHPAPTTQPPNEPWIWTKLRPPLTRKTPGRPAEDPEISEDSKTPSWTGSGRVWPRSCVPVAAG